MTSNKELLKGNSELLILSILTEQPMHGYSLSRKLNAEMPGLFKFGVGMLYPLLHKLERQGYISGKWEAGNNEKRKKIYSITRSGKKQYAHLSREWRSFSRKMNNMLSSSGI